MAAELTRRYNRSPQQLHDATTQAIAARFPGRAPQVVEGGFVVRTGPHWPLTSLGEQVEVSLRRPGTVHFRSFNRPALLQVFEPGDNLANVEGLARMLDMACIGLPPHCPNCAAALPAEPGEGPAPGTPPAPGAAAAPPETCPACGYRLFDLRRQQPVPDNATTTRWMTCAFFLLFVLPSLVMLAAVVYVRLRPPQ
jgi:hypothetical protein